MMIVGLTGSIGMGKTTTAAMFKELGVPVWDADGAVHRLYGAGGAAVEPVSAVFVGVLTPQQTIDRDLLSKSVLNKPHRLKALETIVHPLVGADRAAFMAQAREDGVKLALVDVPLLFETGGQAHVDRVIVVSCDQNVQRQRVLARAGMTPDKFAAILARQTPDAEKRARANFIITTDSGLDDTREQVGRVYKHLTSEAAEKSENS